MLEEGSPGEDGYSKVFIVDGQQRITTLMVFLSVLLDKLEKSENPPAVDSKVKLAKRRYLIDELSGVVKFRTRNVSTNLRHPSRKFSVADF